MKKAGLTVLGVAGACAACCAIPLAIPIIGTLSISGLSLLAIDQFLLGPAGVAIAVATSLGVAVWARAWYVGQRRKRSSLAHSSAACAIPGSKGAADLGAKEVVQEVIRALGFDAIDAGPLADSWRQHPGTPAYCRDLDAAALKAALAQADAGQIASYRKKADEEAAPYFAPTKN